MRLAGIFTLGLFWSLSAFASLQGEMIIDEAETKANLVLLEKVPGELHNFYENLNLETQVKMTQKQSFFKLLTGGFYFFAKNLSQAHL